MKYTPNHVCCPSCKEEVAIDDLECTCQQCDTEFNPFLTFGGCLNCYWTAGRLRCRACGNRFDLSEWTNISRGERNLFHFFRRLLVMREQIQIRSLETTETPQDQRMQRMSSVVELTARVTIRGRRVEKSVQVEDTTNILIRLITEGMTLEERMGMERREFHLERHVFERAVKRLTKDLRLAGKLRPMIKDSIIRMNLNAVEKLSGQMKALRTIYDMVKGKKADLFFTLYKGQSLQINHPMADEPAKNEVGMKPIENTPNTMLVTDFPSWSDAIYAGSEKLLDFFENLIQAGSMEGHLMVCNTQPALIQEFSSSFFSKDFLQCSKYLLDLFEGMEQYENCARIITLQNILKAQPYSTDTK